MNDIFALIFTIHSCCRAREPSKMPRAKDEVHQYFFERIEKYNDEKGNPKERVIKTCNLCNEYKVVLRNVEQLVAHLAAPERGIGAASGCRNAPPAVREKFANRIAAKEDTKKRKMSAQATLLALESAEKARKSSTQTTITTAFAASQVLLPLVLC